MNEHDPVDAAEFVYRRIHLQYFTPLSPTPVRLEAFRPTQADTTGLSVFRANLAQSVDCLPVDPSKRALYAVARLPVQEMLALGLTLVADPLPGGPPGHALVPELSWGGYHANKAQWKPVLAALAKLASADIVHQPA